MRWAVLVVWKSGTQEYVCPGFSDRPAIFTSRKRAVEMAAGFRAGMGAEVQSINVVRAPKDLR